nr:MAG: RNA-dependent RNA polymerase [flactilig virus 1]
MSDVTVRTGLTKNQFQNAIRPVVEPLVGRLALTHEHPESAALRNAAASAITTACAELGFDQHCLQAADCESRGAVSETLIYHWFRDLVRLYRVDLVRENAAVTMVDVDYYVDMRAVLATGKPVILYTLMPEKAADRCGDYTYRFEGDEVVADSGNGVVYRHELWDYRVDQVTAATQTVLTLYDVCRLRLAANRYVVCFVPRLHLPVLACVPGFKLPPMLRRRRIGTNGVTCLASAAEPTKLSLALQHPLAFDSITLEVEIVEIVRRRLEAMTASRVLDISDTARWLESLNLFKGPAAQVAALLLVKYVSGQPVELGDVPTLMDMRERPAVRSQAVQSGSGRPPVAPPSFVPPGDGDGRAVGAVLTPPLVEQPAVAPVRAPAQDVVTVHRRVIEPANRARPPLIYGKWACAFVSRVVPDEKRGLGRPIDLRQVIDHQIKPMQRLRNARAGPWHVAPFNVEHIAVRAFQKAEAYSGAKPARNISQVPVGHCLALSGYLLAMKKAVLVDHRWFGPGRDPAETTRAVEDIVCHGSVVARDFTNFDATISEWVFKHVTVPACMRWVASDQADSLRKLLMAETNAKAKTRFGVTYSPGFGRLSGSPTTSDHNTIINAFVSFCGFMQAGYSIGRAWDALGIYYGDDSLESYPSTVDVHMASAASALGFTVKTSRLARGPYPFLGRYFTGGWSFADPWRTMAKIHATYSRSESSGVVLANRIAGYMVTDAQTPILGVWCRRVMEILVEQGVVPKMSSMDHDDWWRCSQAWPQTGLDRDAFLAVTGLAAGEVDQLEDAINRSRQLDELPTIPGSSPAGLAARVDKPGFFVDGDPTPSAPKMENNATTTATASTETSSSSPSTSGGRTTPTAPPRSRRGRRRRTGEPSPPKRDSSGQRPTHNAGGPGRASGAPPRPSEERVADTGCGRQGGRLRDVGQGVSGHRRAPRRGMAGPSGGPVRQVPVHRDDPELAASGEPALRRERRGVVRPQPLGPGPRRVRRRNRQLPRSDAARGSLGSTEDSASAASATHVVRDDPRQAVSRGGGHAGCSPNRVVRHPVGSDQGSDSVHVGAPLAGVPAGAAKPNGVIGHDGVFRTGPQERLRRHRQAARRRKAAAFKALGAPAAPVA